MLETQVPHPVIYEGLAAFSGFHKQRHNCVLIQARNALRTPNRVPLKQQLQGENGTILRDVHRVQRAAVGLCVGFAALRAAETAQSIAMFSDTLAMHVASLASY